MMIIYDENVDERVYEHLENLFEQKGVWGPLGYVLASWLVPKKLSRPSNDQVFAEENE